MSTIIRTPGRRGGLRASRRRLSLALLLSVGIIAPFAHHTAASADTTNPDVLCRSDPIIVVNGAIVDVASTLQSDPASIREIDYQVTVPSGALLGRTTLTLGLGVPENVSYVFSPTQPRGSVQVAVTVVPRDGVASFPTSVRVSSLLAGNATASGTSDASLSVALDHLLML